jgi:hypothetical protein
MTTGQKFASLCGPNCFAGSPGTSPASDEMSWSYPVLLSITIVCWIKSAGCNKEMLPKEFGLSSFKVV